MLAERVPATARDLVRMIHRINPTKEGAGPKEASERYRLKAGLQSLLIRRFGEGLIVEQQDVNQPQLIGIRLRNFDEDACHVMIHELDEEARSWVQRQIDERQFDRFRDSPGFRGWPKGDPSATSPEAGPVEEKLSVSELLQLGRKALEEFDYERSKALYRRSLERSGGGLEPAIALLEILIEHLAAYEEALALSEFFSPSTLKDKGVRIQLAIAYARLNRIESALATIQRIVEPEAAEVYYLAVKHFIAQQGEKQALDQMAPLKACGSTEFLLETGELEREIQALQDKRLEPLEEEMLRSWQEGAVEEASGLAQRLLSLMPENKAARRILRELEKKVRQEKIGHLLHLAEEAKARQDFGREADFLSQVLAMGENTPRLKRLLAEAQRQALLQQEMAEIDAVVASWSDGERKEALLSYAGLKTSQRERIRERIQDLHFAWMEQVLDTPGTVKPFKLSQAVLALKQCTDALHSGADPQQVITQLRIHGKILQSIPQAQNILVQAETRLRTLEEKKRKRLLDEAEAFLAAKDLHMAGERIAQLKGMGRGKTDRDRFETIKRLFFQSQKIQTLRKRYEESIGRGEEVTCRRLADRLARLLEGGPAKRWANKVTEHTEAIRTQWCLSTADLSGLPGNYGSIGIGLYSDEGSCLLLPGGRQILIASSHDRWVFLRAFDLNERRFHRGYLLRAPRPLGFARATLDGDTVWVYDLNGQVFQVGLDPFDILFWQDLGTLVAGEGEYEEALLCPQSRLLWLKKGGTTEKWDDFFEIVNIDRGRNIRRIRSTGYPIRIHAGGKYRTVLQDLSYRSVRICSDNGRVLDTFAFETKGNSHHAAVHPNGTDFVFLPFDDTGTLDPVMDPEKRGDLMLVLEVKPDPERKHKPIKISHSDAEALHGIATSLDHGIVYTHFFNGSEEYPGRQLAAWKLSEHGFEMIFRVPVPDNVMMAGDESTRQVAAVAFSDTGLEAHLLNERPPEFSADLDDPYDEMRIPPFEAPWICSSPTGMINAASMSFMLQLRNDDLNGQRRMIREMKKSGSADELAGMVSALDRVLRIDEARTLKRWMGEKYPDHYRVRIELADEASDNSDWPRVIDVLEGLPRDGLDDGSARHLCHLLGIGYFIRGEMEKALGAWKDGLAYEDGRCELEPYIDYAETALLSPESRRNRKAESPVARMLSIFEQVDRHLAHGQWHEAITAVESAYSLTNTDLMILARLAEAYLQVDCTPGEMSSVCKVLALAHFLDRFKNSYKQDPVLPPCIEKWPESRVEEVARKAEHWLKNCARFPRQVPATATSPGTSPPQGPP